MSAFRVNGPHVKSIQFQFWLVE